MQQKQKRMESLTLTDIQPTECQRHGEVQEDKRAARLLPPTDSYLPSTLVWTRQTLWSLSDEFHVWSHNNVHTQMHARTHAGRAHTHT